MSSLTHFALKDLRLRCHCNPPSLGINRFLWSLVLLRNFVSDWNDRLMSRVSIKVIVKIFKCPIRGLRVQKVYDRNKGDYN
jgi:hypothetical protein